VERLVRFRGGYKHVTGKDGVTRRQWPAMMGVRRISKVRYERLLALLEMFKAGKSIQEISRETGWRKDKLYHEMYYLKNHGLLAPDFKNPFSVWSTDLAKEISKGVSKK